jgi:hypothetical protein
MAKKVAAKTPKPSNEGGVFVSRVYKDHGIVKAEENKVTEMIEVQTYAPNIPLAHVEFASQMTLNLGNFESVQCRVAVTLPSRMEEMDEAYQSAKHFVEARLTKEMDEIREYRASKQEKE